MQLLHSRPQSSFVRSWKRAWSNDRAFVAWIRICILCIVRLFEITVNKPDPVLGDRRSTAASLVETA